jgi:hypothetical protein
MSWTWRARGGGCSSARATRSDQRTAHSFGRIPSGTPDPRAARSDGAAPVLGVSRKRSQSATKAGAPTDRSFAVVSPGASGQTPAGKRAPMLGKWPFPNKLSEMPAWARGLWIRRVLVRAQEGQLESPALLTQCWAFCRTRAQPHQKRRAPNHGREPWALLRKTPGGDERENKPSHRKETSHSKAQAAHPFPLHPTGRRRFGCNTTPSIVSSSAT